MNASRGCFTLYGRPHNSRSTGRQVTKAVKIGATGDPHCPLRGQDGQGDFPQVDYGCHTRKYRTAPLWAFQVCAPPPAIPTPTPHISCLPPPSPPFHVCPPLTFHVCPPPAPHISCLPPLPHPTHHISCLPPSPPHISYLPPPSPPPHFMLAPPLPILTFHICPLPHPHPSHFMFAPSSASPPLTVHACAPPPFPTMMKMK